MRCSAGKSNGCNFELRAERPNLGIGHIRVYAHSKHNHPLMSEGKYAFIFASKIQKL
jgi:hypothetical protein